jgi:serine O-acetyltransferase
MLWYSPLLVLLPLSRARTVIDADVRRWIAIVGTDRRSGRDLLWLLARYPEFRTLFYYRVRRGSSRGALVASAFSVVYPGERTLHLASSEIGPGLFIQHGFATVVAAARVGADCWINQQVTIGFDAPESRPVLGDRVSVHAGAKVLGAVTIGDGARIGANAVVLNDVPAGFTAVGVPARNIPPKAERS